MTAAVTLLIAGLAAFRLALLLSEDTGPAKIFQKLRSFLRREAKEHPAIRKTDLHRGIACLRCSSVWVAAPVAAYVLQRDKLKAGIVIAGDIFLWTMAVSAMAILWNRAFPKR